MQEDIRISDPTSLDTGFIDKELKEGKHIIVQFSKNIYGNEILAEINRLCNIYDKRFGVRFYEHDYTAFNGETLEAIPGVKCLYIDSLHFADNLYALNNLTNLQKFSLGVYELKETEILKITNLKKITDLILWETKTKALNLQFLNEYSNLNYLRLRAHTKNIFAIEELKNLNYLSLELIKNTLVSFINNLKNLKTLKFILGSRENIHEVSENEIEDLEISFVRGFNDLSNISKFRKLKRLSIEGNIQFRQLAFDKNMPFLKRIHISNCKAFNSLTGLSNLTSLESIGIYETNLDFNNLIQQDLPKSLKSIKFYTTQKKLNEKIRLKIKALGYTE